MMQQQAEAKWWPVEYTLPAGEAAVDGQVQLVGKKLLFRSASSDDRAELSLAAVEAVKQEEEVVCLRMAAPGAGEARLRVRDVAFVALLAREVARETSPPQSAPSLALEEKEKPRVRFPTLGFVAFRSVEVTSPVEVSWNGDSYVVFAVRSRVMMAQDGRAGGAQEEREWVVHHRYTDFERFDARLRALVTSQLDSNLVLLPVLPQKPWLPHSCREFVESRCRKLDRYLKAMMSNGELVKRVQYLELLLAFVSEGEGSGSSAALGKVVSANATLLGKTVLAANHGLSRLLDTRNPPSPEEDYDYICGLMRKQGLGSHIGQVACWNKLVLGVFGTTSSGKSSLVSHLFTVVCAASSSAGQVDTGFTIVEAVNTEEFSRYSEERSFPDFSLEELKAPLSPADQNLCGDRRYGRVFVYLSAAESFERYSQQLSEGGALRRHAKLRSVLVHDRYLTGTPQEVALAKRLILFDSKGVDASSFDAGDERMWPEIEAMQFVAKISHLNLFLIPADDIRNCSPAIALFELAVVCSEEGLEVLRAQKKKILQEKKAGGGGGEAGAGTAGAGRDPFAGLVSRMLGVDGLLGAAHSAVSSLASYLLPRSHVAIESGTSRWQKTFFLLSRADHVVRSGAGESGGKEQLFFELGLAFGQRLAYLQPPAFSRLALLALPEKQTDTKNPFLGFLAEFKAYLLRQANEASAEAARDEALLAMTAVLAGQASTGGWISLASLHWQSTYVAEARSRALARRSAHK